MNPSSVTVALGHANRNYQVLGTLEPKEVLPLVRRAMLGGPGSFVTSTLKHPVAEVRVDHVGLRPFVGSLECYRCGLAGEVFVVRRNPNSLGAYGDWHLTLFSRDGRMLTCDHLTPKALGGTDDPANLGTMCAKCNSKKGKKPLEAWNG